MKGVPALARPMNKIAHGINVVVEVIVVMALVSVLVLLIVTVVGRYVFRISAPWVPEFVAYATAVIGAFGFSCLVHRRTLLAITFITDKFPAAASKAFDLLVWIGIILYFWLFIRYGIVFAESARGQFTPSLAFRLGQVRLIMPIGGVLIVFQALNNLVQDVHAWLAEDKIAGSTDSQKSTTSTATRPETEPS